MTALESAALAWVIAKREAETLRHARVMQECDFCPVVSDDPAGPTKTKRQDAPCFRNFCVPVGPEDPPTTKPVAEWCPSCQRRQVIHVQYRAATKARGIANRALQLLCAAELRRQATRDGVKGRTS